MKNLIFIILLTACASPLPLAPKTPATAPAPGVTVPAATRQAGGATTTRVPATVTPAKMPPLRTLPEARVRGTQHLRVRPGLEQGEVQVAAGETVVLLGIDEGRQNFRVLVDDTIGWIPVTGTDYPDPAKIPALRPPPPCARFLGRTQGLSGQFVNPTNQELVVVADLYRDTAGSDYPNSTFGLQVNGAMREQTRRTIGGKGQYLLRGSAIPVPGVSRAGDRIGFSISGGPREQLTLLATVFAVAPGCTFTSGGR